MATAWLADLSCILLIAAILCPSAHGQLAEETSLPARTSSATGMKRDAFSMYRRRFISGAIQGVKKGSGWESSLGSGYEWETKHFTQTLDHFSFSREGQQTFQQKYIMWRGVWGGADENAPIFVYCGNEGPVEWFANNAGFIREAAVEFRALVVAPEHRYYGESMPFGSVEAAYKDADSLAYLTTEQAIADYAILLTDLKKNLSAEHSAIVLFGGSYGGMIAAWFRLKYPHIAVGAIASSAPILQFGDIVPADTFYRIASEDFRKESETCFQTIRSSWDIIEASGSTLSGLRDLSLNFHMCRRLAGPWELKDWLASAYSYLAMVDYPLPSDFLMPLPAHPVREVCRAMDSLPPEAGTLSRIFAGVSVYYNYSGKVECFEPTEDPHGMSGWDYQYCTEMVMPFASNASNSMFEPFDWDLTAVERGCVEQFGVMPRPAWVLTEFGGKDIRTVLKHFGSNIVFSNGGLDPWSGGGVLESISDTIVASIIADGAHHLDLRPSTANDPPSVVAQRNFEKAQIRLWLDEHCEERGRQETQFRAPSLNEHGLEIFSLAALLGLMTFLFAKLRLSARNRASLTNTASLRQPLVNAQSADPLVRPNWRVLLVAVLLPAVAVAEDGGVGLPAELVEGNFNSSLEAALAPWALVEFYANWCPACQHFKPHYEQVAKLFMAPEAPYPNLIYVARVDCANQGVLCKRFDVTQYPTMYFAPPPEMARASRAGPKTVGAIEPVEGGYAAASLLHWMAERLQQPFVLDAERKAEGAAGGGAAFLTRGHVKASLLDMEEATVVAFDFIFSSLRLSPPMRPALGKVLHLFTAHHPSPLCRQGSAALLASLPDLWPPSSSLSASLSAEAELDGEHVQALQKHRICGPNGARGFWKDCKGSRPGTRGYSCGLWELFHSLTTRLDADEGAVGLAAIHAFVEHFFGCGPCRMHFLSMAARLEMEEVQTGREAVLWLWRAHNEVNRRLAEEEAADEQRADPQFPKRQWPPPELCPSCRGDGSGQWDEEQVHRFLVNHFAQPLNEPLPANATVSETIHRISVATTVEEEGKEGSQPSTGYVFGVAIVLLVLLAIAIFSSRSCRRTQQRRRKLSRRWGPLPP